ncbi:MAG TPA: hypothetical protein VKB47_08720 [Terracidiphilus sp.]|nr:hypothetical protein [Terracidiphilus sp.]
MERDELISVTVQVSDASGTQLFSVEVAGKLSQVQQANMATPGFAKVVELLNNALKEL